MVIEQSQISFDFREMIGEGIERLQMHAAGGGTNLATGLSKVRMDY